ncbi:MAG: DEAD/DEAH box helicase [Pseudomonadales bacterium]|nr:DEAD/DEAH box helicase [Pseudomonadales bacterium]
MINVDLEELWQNYESLSVDECRILQVMSVAYAPVNQMVLKKILQILVLPGYKLINKTWREKMIGLGLVDLSQGKLICSRQFASQLTVELLSEGDFERVLKATLTLLPLHTSQVFGNEFTEPAQLRRQIRNAIFGTDEAAFVQLLDLDSPFAAMDADNGYLILDVVLPLNTVWFKSLPESFRYQILRACIDNQLIHIGEIGHLVGMLRDCHEAGISVHPASIALLAECEFYAMNQAAAESLLNATPGLDADRVRAIGAFLRDENDLALAFFARSIQEQQRASKKRKVFIRGLAGAIYSFALVGSGTANSLRLLQRQVENAVNSADYDPFSPVYRLILDFQNIWEGKINHHDALDMLVARDIDAIAPYMQFCLGVVFYWLDKPVPENLMVALENIADPVADQDADLQIENDDDGLAWQRMQAVNLLGLLNGSMDKLDQGLVALMPKLAPWERALNALAKLGGADEATDVAAQLADSRLVWFLSKGYRDEILLEPKEQKLRKNGDWTKGRQVSLKRLHQAAYSIPNLTPQDKKIISFIETDVYRYHNDAYFMNYQQALLAAAGHPNIYWLDQPKNAVDITVLEPELIVTEDDGYVAINIFPSQDGDSVQLVDAEEDDMGTIDVVMENPGRIDIYQFNDSHQQIAGILGEQGLRVPEGAKDKVLSSISLIAPMLTVHSDIGGLEDESVLLVDADHRLYINIQPVADGLKLNIAVQPFGGGPRFLPGQGGATVFAEIDNQRLRTNRDIAAEQAILQSVLEHCPDLADQGGGQWLFDDLQQSLEGLLKLQQKEAAGELVFSWPEGKKITLHKEVGIRQTSMAVQSQTNWFEVVGEVQATESDVLDLQKILSLMGDDNGRFIRLEDNEFITLTAELQKRLEQLKAISNDGRVHRLAGYQLDELSEDMSFSSDNGWQQFQNGLVDAKNTHAELPGTFEGELRDYQLEGFSWLSRLAAWGAGACLADDMGLGKTIQSLALILSRATEGPTLIIAPTSLCLNWYDEAQQFTPTLRPILFGPGNRAEMMAGLGAFDMLICSYGLLTTEVELITGIQWRTVVADEAQAFKNLHTRRSQAVMKIEAEFKVITTGTPVENHLGELWNLFNFINPGLLGSYKQFNHKYARAIEQSDYSGQHNLKHLISPFILRRLKRDVLKELPPRTDITLSIELSKEEAALYEALRREALTEVQAGHSEMQRRMIVLAQITRLRRAVCNPALVLPEVNIPSAKLAALGQLVDELLENNHKALVFSQFVGHLALIRKYLDERGIFYQYLDGKTPPAKRRQAVNAFQAGEGQLFLISLKAGGSGLNLTAADYVIHMDPWWNPAVEDQASDRAHRIGQQRPVTVYRLVAINTIEQTIVDLHKRKRDLADRLLDGAEIGAKMSFDEMLTMIKSDPVADA